MDTEAPSVGERTSTQDNVSHVDALNRVDKFFELDSAPPLLHHEITSQPAQRLVAAKSLIACQPCSRHCQSPDLVVLHRNLSPCRSAFCADSVLVRLRLHARQTWRSYDFDPQFGMTLHFAVPAQGAQGRFPKAGTTASAR